MIVAEPSKLPKRIKASAIFELHGRPFAVDLHNRPTLK